MFLTANSAIVGCFAQIQKKTLVGDAVSHAVLPGICLVFIIFNTKNFAYLLLGALGTGWLSIIALDSIYKHSKLKQDPAISIVLSIFFSAGIFLLSIIQHTGKANQAGLQRFIFGNAASLMTNELITATTIATIVITTIILLFRPLKIFCFDPMFAKTIGINTKLLNVTLQILLVLSIIISIQSVGIVLMTAMLIIPPAAANTWSNKLYKVLIISGIIGLVSGLVGTTISYQIKNMPTGPWIVLIMFLIAIISFLFAPEKGLIKRTYTFYKRNKQRTYENILKLLYELGESNNNFYMPHHISSIISQRPSLSHKQLTSGLNQLNKDQLVEKIHTNQWQLTPKGKQKGKYILNLHHLWEEYLENNLKIDTTITHQDAEAMEHIITPELEKEIKHAIKKLKP
jgi:manganese/zinc/iron transport system permease protein